MAKAVAVKTDFCGALVAEVTRLVASMTGWNLTLMF